MTTAINSRILRIISLLVTFCFFSLPAYAKYSGGMGDPNDPYQIATAESLILLGDSPEDYDKHFILISDIDLSDRMFERAVIAWDTTTAASTTATAPARSQEIYGLVA